MAISYKWTVRSIKTQSQISEKQNVVKIVDFMLEGIRNEKNNFILGTVELTFDPSSDSFIPYDDLTEETVIEWVKSALGIEKIDQYIETIETRFGSDNEIETALPWISIQTESIDTE